MMVIDDDNDDNNIDLGFIISKNPPFLCLSTIYSYALPTRTSFHSFSPFPSFLHHSSSSLSYSFRLPPPHSLYLTFSYGTVFSIPNLCKRCPTSIEGFPPDMLSAMERTENSSCEGGCEEYAWMALSLHHVLLTTTELFSILSLFLHICDDRSSSLSGWNATKNHVHSSSFIDLQNSCRLLTEGRDDEDTTWK